MKRANISTVLCDRIEKLMGESPTVRTGTCGPQHDPYGCLDAYIDVRSALGRFLTKKGYVNKELFADDARWCTSIIVNLQRRPRGQAPFLRMRAVSF